MNQSRQRAESGAISINQVDDRGFGLLDLEYVAMGASAVLMATHRLSRLLRNEPGELLINHGRVGLPRWRISAILVAEAEISQKELTQLTKIEQRQTSRAFALMEEEEQKLFLSMFEPIAQATVQASEF